MSVRGLGGRRRAGGRGHRCGHERTRGTDSAAAHFENTPLPAGPVSIEGAAWTAPHIFGHQHTKSRLQARRLGRNVRIDGAVRDEAPEGSRRKHDAEELVGLGRRVVVGGCRPESVQA